MKRTVKYVYKLTLTKARSYRRVREKTNKIVQSKQQSHPTSEKMLDDNTQKLT